MPLVRVEVRNEYGLGVPDMYMEAAAANDGEPKKILEGVAVAGLVGLLRQLGDLADFAAEVFHGLQEEVIITCSRSRKLMVCVERIEAAIVPVEKAVLSQRSHLHFAYTAGVNWHAPARCEQNHFIYSDMPQFIFDSYEDCRDPPQFQLLDRFDHGGPGSCMKRYSDPTIFNNAPKASADASFGKLSRYKKVEKSKNKRSSWRRNGEVSQDASNVGGNAPPCQTIWTYYAALRSDLYQQSISDQRNESGCSKEDICSSYSMQPQEEEVPSASGRIQINLTDQEQGVCSSYLDNSGEEPAMKDYDHDTNLESLIPRLDASQLTLVDDAFSFQTVDRLKVETWNHTCVWGSASHVGDSVSETENIEDKAADDGLPEHIKQNLKSQSSNSESNIVFDNLLGGDYNFRDNDSGMPIIGDSANSHEPDKPVEETSKVTSVALWTNGGFLGLQPSKPPLCSILNDLPQFWLSNGDGESSSSTQLVILHDRDPHDADYVDGSSAQVNSELQDARNHPEITRSSPRMFELSSQLLSTLSEEKQLEDGEEDSSHASYLNSNALEQRKNPDFAYQSSSSPPLAHMKISFQPIDGFMTSKLKLKFMDGINDQGSTDVSFPSFQLVPEVSSTRLNVGSDSDSDEDAFYSRLSSPSLSDDFHNHHSESSCDIKQSESSSSQQQKVAPSNHDQNLETASEQESKVFSSEMSDAQREGNGGRNIDENNFLNQIRTKSMNLRPTEPAKPTLQPESSNNVQVMTILNKATAIRQAVGSDDGDNWSDT